MSALVVYTETGVVPHAGCVLDFENPPRRKYIGWYPDSRAGVGLSGRKIDDWAGGWNPVPAEWLDLGAGIANFLANTAQLQNGRIGFAKPWEKTVGEGNDPYEIHYYVKFSVKSDSVLEAAERKTVREYVDRNRFYMVGVRDCVTFARDIARYCGLQAFSRIPRQRIRGKYVNHEIGGEGFDPDFLPYELLRKLYELNPDRVVSHNWDNPGLAPPKP